MPLPVGQETFSENSNRAARNQIRRLAAYRVISFLFSILRAL
jgi:hypothetical protein